jgi:hypothetical protein
MKEVGEVSLRPRCRAHSPPHVLDSAGNFAGPENAMTPSYRERIEAAIAPLLTRGFRITEGRDEAPRHFGNARVTLSSEVLSLRVTSDRGQTSLDVATLAGGGWYSLDEILKQGNFTADVGPWDSAGEAVEQFQLPIVIQPGAAGVPISGVLFHV